MKNFTDCTPAEKVERWENVLRVLRGLTRHQRKAHWNMREWATVTDCGTIACAAGHCAFDPWFQKQGLKAEIRQGFSHNYVTLISNSGWRSTMEFFFGTKGYESIFINTTHRPVGAVIREVRAHIKELRNA